MTRPTDRQAADAGHHGMDVVSHMTGRLNQRHIHVVRTRGVDDTGQGEYWHRLPVEYLSGGGLLTAAQAVSS
jgi:hypothetical protein